jgi:hypothetical protein
MLIAFSFMIFYFSGSCYWNRLWDNFIDIGLQGCIYQIKRVFIRYYLMQGMNTVFMSLALGTAAGSAFGLFLWRFGGWHCDLRLFSIISISFLCVCNL